MLCQPNQKAPHNGTPFLLHIFCASRFYFPQSAGYWTAPDIFPETPDVDVVLVETIGHGVNSHFGPVRPTYDPSGHIFASIVHATTLSVLVAFVSPVVLPSRVKYAYKAIPATANPIIHNVTFVAVVIYLFIAILLVRCLWLFSFVCIVFDGLESFLLQMKAL